VGAHGADQRESAFSISGIVYVVAALLQQCQPCGPETRLVFGDHDNRNRTFVLG
jgi:hypothetical protein